MRRLGVALVLVSTSAFGSEEEADRLFEEGRALLAEGRTSEACQRFSASAKLSHTGGTVLNLAECWVRLGRTASAWARYREAAELARAAGRESAERLATERADALEKDLPYLTVAIDGDDIEVRRDGEPLPRSKWGVAVPVDPGEHVVEASRPGHSTFRWRKTFAPRDNERVVPALVPIEAPRPPKRSQGAAPIVGFGLIGAGAVALGVTAVLAGIAAAQSSSANAACPVADRCGDMAAVARAGDAKTLANVATGTFIGGAILAAAGVTVVIAWPRGER